MKTSRTPFRPRLEELESRLLLAQRIWDGRPDAGGTSANNKWLTATNWVGDVAPSPGDDLVFAPGAANLTNINDFAIGTGFRSITFSGSGDNVLPSNSIVLGSGGIKATNAGGSNTFAPSFDAFAATAPTRSLEVTSAGAELRLTGNLGRDATLFKDGAGKLTLSGNSTFTGALTVIAGTLSVTSDTALGATAALTRVATGATLQIAGTTTANGFAEPIRLDDGAVLLGTAGVSLSLVGNILLAGSAVIEVPENAGLELHGALSDVVTGVAGGFTKRGGGGLLLYQAGSYTGTTTVEEGSLSIGNAMALGATGSAARTIVRAGATLSSFGTLTVNEALTLDGARGPGADPATLSSGGTLTWAGPITLSNNARLATFPAGFGGTTTVLTVTGAVSGTGDLALDGASGFAVAPSILFAGSSANTYSGTTTVESGVVRLNKPTGVIAIPGPLVIGTALLQVNGPTATSGSNQIASTSAVTINGGTLELNGRSNTVASLTMTGGQVTTGTGTLTLGGDVTATADAGGNAARIDGNLSLGAADRTFTVTPTSQSGQELVVNAVVSGGSFIGLIKGGAGDMALTGANTYTGSTDIKAGSLMAASATALGAGFSSGGNGIANALRATTVEGGATLSLGGPNGMVVNEQITIIATPAGVSEKAIFNADGQSRTLAAPVILNGSAEVGGFGQLILSGRVSEGGTASDFIKYGSGEVVMSGTNANTYGGATRVEEGRLVLNKSPGITSVPGSLILGVAGVSNATVRLDAADQIADDADVTAVFFSQLSLSGGSERLHGLDLTESFVGTAGNTLTLTGPVISRASTTTVASSISGRVLLDGSLGEAGPITVEEGNPAVDFEILGEVAGTAALVKRGAGTMRLSGGTDNTFSGNTSVEEGGLELNKGSGAQAVPGNLFVGTTSGPAGARAVWLGDDQVADGAPILLVNGALVDLNGHSDTVGSLALDGSTVSTGVGLLRVMQTVSVGDGALPATINGRLDTTNFSVGVGGPELTVNAVVSTGTPAVKFGDGTLVLNGANTFAAGLDLHDGLTLVNGDQAGSAVVLKSPAGAAVTKATLGGVGDVGAVTVLDGSLDPGTATGGSGTLTVHGALTFSDAVGSSDTRSYHVDLNRGLLNPVSDRLTVLGSVNLGNEVAALSVKLNFTPTTGDQFVIIDNDGTADAVVGQFAGLPEGAPFSVGSWNFTISYKGLGGHDNDVVLTYHAQDPDGNHAPVLAPIGPQTVTVGHTLSLTAAATDANGDLLTYRLVNDPAEGGRAALDPVTGTFTWTPSVGSAGTHTFTVEVSDNGPTPLTSRVTFEVTVLVPPPAVQINDGSAQRSKVNSITVTFDGAVTFDAGAFELRRQDGTAVELRLSNSVVAGRTVAVLTFLGPDVVGGSLADGTYTLVTHGDRIHDEAGHAVDADGDGTEGGDRVDAFFRLFGDGDGDGDVDESDRLQFRASFHSELGDLDYRWFFDYDGDGTVGGSDNGQFNRRRTH